MPDLLERLRAALADRYAVESEIGRGGMATVFLANDLKHNRKVAIKVLHPELAAAVGSDRFLREIETVAGLNHPHVLPLHDSGEADGLLFFVMPYVDGASLRERLDVETQLPVDEAVRIAVEIADGLDYAHRQGIIHRDVKPGNVLLSEGHAVITDFGIARAVYQAQGEGATQAGLGLGTPLYASPEQAVGNEMLDGRADIYSLGCVAYEMLAGAPPLTGVTPQQIQARRVAETPSSLTMLRDTVPLLVDQAIARALARVPADRFRTAGEFGQALRSAVLVATPSTTGGFAPLPAHGAARSRRRRWPIAAAGVVAALALAGWLLEARPWRGDESPALGQDGVVERQLTTSGRVVETALSPSGEQVAFCEMEGSGYRLKLLETSPGATPTDLAIFEICRLPRWMPDGESVVVFGQAKGERATYRVSRHGGAPTPVGPPAFPFALSPDGTFLVVPTASRRGLEILPVSDSAGVEALAMIDVPGDYQSLSDVDWSPDGERLAVATHGTGSSAIRLVNVAESGSERILVQETGRVLELQWIAGSDALLYLRESVNGTDLMRVEVPDGDSGDAISERVRSVGMSTSLGLSDDERLVVITRHQPRSTFVTASPDPSGDASTSTVRPQQQVEQEVVSLTLSDDGAWVHYVGAGASGRDLYRLPTNGGQPERVTHSGDVRFADWSPDGRFLAYVAPLGDEMRLWIISRHGGSPGIVENVLVGRAGQVSWQPDRLYYHHPDGQNFGILSGLEVWSEDEWTRLRDEPDEPFVSRRRIRATSEIPLISNDTLGTMFGPHSSPATPDVVVEWNRGSARSPWLISAADGSQTRLGGRGWPLGWTSDGSALYWQIGRELFVRPLTAEEMRPILTLPERLFGCGRDHGAAVEHFLCFEREDNANVWLLEGLDL